jgi:hypothetical protein
MHNLSGFEQSQASLDQRFYYTSFIESQQAKSPFPPLPTGAEISQDAALDVIVEIGISEGGDRLHVSEREILSVQSGIVDVVIRYQSS